MLSVFGDAKGVILMDFLKKGPELQVLIMPTKFSKLRDFIKGRRRGKIRKGVLLHQDNASSSKSSIATAAIAKPSFKLVEHPSYSSDLVLSDYRLFPKLKEHMRGIRFPSNNNVTCAIKQ
ncbi:hypothetical protein Trydic_g3404 [Trypoxylus dichotomus]